MLNLLLTLQIVWTKAKDDFSYCKVAQQRSTSQRCSWTGVCWPAGGWDAGDGHPATQSNCKPNTHFTLHLLTSHFWFSRLNWKPFTHNWHTCHSLCLCSAVRRWRACRARCLRRRSCALWWRDVWWRIRWHGGGSTLSWWRTTGWPRTWTPRWRTPEPATLNCFPVSPLMGTAAFILPWKIKHKLTPLLMVSLGVLSWMIHFYILQLKNKSKSNFSSHCSCGSPESLQCCRANEEAGILWRRTG